MCIIYYCHKLIKKIINRIIRFLQVSRDQGSGLLVLIIIKMSAETNADILHYKHSSKRLIMIKKKTLQNNKKTFFSILHYY